MSQPFRDVEAAPDEPAVDNGADLPTYADFLEAFEAVALELGG